MLGEVGGEWQGKEFGHAWHLHLAVSVGEGIEGNEVQFLAVFGAVHFFEGVTPCLEFVMEEVEVCLCPLVGGGMLQVSKDLIDLHGKDLVGESLDHLEFVCLCHGLLL